MPGGANARSPLTAKSARADRPILWHSAGIRGTGNLPPHPAVMPLHGETTHAMETPPVAGLGRLRISIDGYGRARRRWRQGHASVRIPVAGPDRAADRHRPRIGRADATHRPTLRDRRAAVWADPRPLP